MANGPRCTSQACHSCQACTPRVELAAYLHLFSVATLSWRLWRQDDAPRHTGGAGYYGAEHLDLKIIRRMVEEWPEALLVQAVQIGIGSVDFAFLQQFHNGIVKGLHAVFFASLQYGRDLKGFPITNQIPHCWSGNENLQSGAASFGISPFEQGLSHDGLQRVRQRGADLFLLLGWE